MAEKTNREERPTQVLEPVYIPKRYPGEDAVFVQCNGKNKLLKTNMTHMLPREFAEGIRNSLAAQAEADARIEAISIG